ncbi:MAG: MATE family efflux transporter [Oscillospiraceae bacterium]|nr:MATE family efflux transporter [Oscillospiraceae bacterium]
MLMVLIYNLADTLFIGMTHDAYQVAAVSMATPVFLISMSVGTVFGIGGTSVISRALGEGKMDYARKACSFCMWACVTAGVGMSALFLIFMDQILVAMGISAETYGFAKSYLTIVTCSIPFVLIANCFSNVIRAEGQAGKAMMGQLLGNLLNVILDPIMILILGWEIAGAAIATVIGNVFSACYYLVYFLQKKSILSIHPKDFTMGNKVCTSILAIGLPASFGSLLMSISQIIMNGQMATFGDMAVAGIGVASKVTMITGMVCIGFGQGVQALLGYCVGANLWDRFKKIMAFSMVFSVGFSCVMTGICYLFADQIVSVFLTEQAAFDYAAQFVRILLSTSFLFGVFYVLANALQAAGAATAALIINLSRQGFIYIPALFVLKAAIGANGLAWAQPVADLLSTALVVFLYIRTVKKMEANSRK